MATAAMTPQLSADRRFFTTMALVIAAAVAIGFAPSFYLRGIVPPAHPYEPVTPLVLLHGAVFSFWVMLFVTQAMLAGSGRVDLHMRVGVLGFVMVPLMLVIGTLVGLHGIDRPLTAPPGIAPLTWAAMPLLDVPVFVGLMAAALAFRGTPHVHKRLMLIAMIDMLQPAVGRMSFIPLPIPATTLLAPAIALAMLVWWDLRTRGRVERATIIGSLIVMGVLLIRPMIWSSQAWLGFVSWAHALVV